MEQKDRRRILSKLNDMTQYIRELREMLPEEDEYQHDLVRRRACEKTIEVAIDSLIDAAAMLVSAEKFGLPATEENIFDILADRKVIRREFCEKLKDMKGFRNILIHRYAYVDDEIVYLNLSSYLNDFHEFASAIEAYLEKEKTNVL